MARDNSPGVLIYNGRPYAVGLLWFTVQEEKAKDLLQSRIKKSHADFYCLRTHISQQHAFGWLDKGHRRGMAVAAAIVADQLVGEWHGVFEADNGWWYVQVRSDTITPNGDRFFVTEEEAFNVFQDEMAKHNWPHAYAPDRWRLGDRGIRELSLKTLLDELVTTALVPANVTALFGSSSMRNLVLGGLGVAFVLMAGIAAYNLLLSPAPVQPQINRANIQKFLATKTKPAVQLVSPQQFAKTCGDYADKLYQPLPGWLTVKFSCNPGGASMTWQQVTGSLNDAKEQGRKVWPATAKITLVQRNLVVTSALDKLPTVEQMELKSQEEQLMYLEQELKPIGAMQVSAVMPSAPAVARRPGAPQNTPAAPVVLPTPYLTITLKTGFAPEKVAPLLMQDGMEIQKIDWSIQQALWEYGLKWYFKRPVGVAPVKPGAVRPGAVQNNGGKK